jgi:thymidine kinase
MDSTTLDELRRTSHGRLEVICGPMFSGKSEELIRRLRRAKVARKQVIAFKHRVDSRTAVEYVDSHDGSKIDAHLIDDPQLLFDLANQDAIEVVGVDEIHFFPRTIIATLCELINNGKRIIVAGLDLNFRGEPFDPMPILLAIADEVTKLRAVCLLCGQDAHYTQRLVNGQPAQYQDPLIMIGTHEAYQARCRNCYIIDKHPEFQIHE